MKNQDYNKTRGALRYWLLGREYYLASKAMEFGLKHHTGVRKDGFMPEYQHQISQMSLVRTLEKSLLFPERTLVCIALHDVVEDIEGVTLRMIEEEFGPQTAADVDLMTNTYADGTKKPKDYYYKQIFLSPVASIAKSADRTHNHQTMPGAFKIAKMRSYVEETQEYIIPGIKMARKLFPEQEPAYQNLKSILQIQMEWVDLLPGNE